MPKSRVLIEHLDGEAKSKHFVDQYCPQVFTRHRKYNNWFYMANDRVKLIIDDVGNFDFKNGEVHLARIEVKPEARGHGFASIAMRALTDGADLYGLTLTLSPHSYCDERQGLAQRNLEAFYRRHGFRARRGYVETNEIYYKRIWSMVRQPVIKGV